MLTLDTHVLVFLGGAAGGAAGSAAGSAAGGAAGSAVGGAASSAAGRTGNIAAELTDADLRDWGFFNMLLTGFDGRFPPVAS